MAGLSGVGLYFKKDAMDRFFVDMILPQTSAEESRAIQRGDILLAIDQRPVAGCTLEDLRALVLGKTGTEVRFRFKREQETDKYTFDVTLLRGRAKSAGGSAPPLPPVPAVIVGGSNGLQNDYARGNKYGGHAEQAAASAWTPGPVPLGGGSENGLREEMTKLRGAEEAMKEEIALLKAAEVTLRGEVTSAKMAEATLKGEVASVEMSETAVKNELASAKEAVEEAQRARRELEEQLSMAQSNMGKGQAELARAQAELGRLKEDSLQMEKRSQEVMFEVQRSQGEAASMRDNEERAVADAKRLRGEVKEIKALLERERESARRSQEELRESVRRSKEELEREINGRVEAARREGAAEAGQRYAEEVAGLERQLQSERDRAGHAFEAAERQHEMQVVAAKRHEEDVAQLRREMADLEAQSREQDGIAQSRVSRLCVIALPHAVAKLHDFLYNKAGTPAAASGAYEHPSTWAQLWAHEYVARLASTTFPLSISAMCAVLEDERTSASQEAVFAMSLVACDDKGRAALLHDGRCIKILSRLLSGPDVVCTRFAAMSLANLSLEEEGRIAITDMRGCLEALVDDVRSDDADVQRFALQALGNQCFLVRCRDALLALPGSLEVLCMALESPHTHSLRYAAGCVRTLAADAKCRESLVHVAGVRRTLLSLVSHKNAKVREHVSAAMDAMYGEETVLQMDAASSYEPFDKRGAKGSALVPDAGPLYRVTREIASDVPRVPSSHSSGPLSQTAPAGYGGPSHSSGYGAPHVMHQSAAASKGAIAAKLQAGRSGGARLSDFDQDLGRAAVGAAGRGDDSRHNGLYNEPEAHVGQLDGSYVRQGDDGETEIHF